MILTLTRDGVRTVSMIPGWSRRLTMVAAVSAVVATPALGLTKCTMDYSLSGWSVVYSTASGSGTITCDDGASARVGLRAKGGGLTAGKSKISNGHGTFSDVGNISELYGSYASAQAHAGAGESTSAQVVTKGTVSLALSGRGSGIDLGVTFGNFIITPRKKK